MEGNRQETRSLEDLVKMIDSNKLLLPEFQRDFKWPIEKSETLFDSIFKDLFIGSLIIAKPKFDLACKGFDLRPRGHKSRRPTSKNYKISDFQDSDIYTLLDGQQRVTSIYRALKGHDAIYVVFKGISDLKSPAFFNKKPLVRFDECIEGFDIKEPGDDYFYVKINDLYDAERMREGEIISSFIAPILSNMSLDSNEQEIITEFALLLFSDFKSDILKKSQLLSVQLLNMDLEKFCLYFERSNSQGLSLSFTDIITAKIYIDFKLSTAISNNKNTYKNFTDKHVEPAIRYLNYISNNEVTKKSILSDLKGSHFIDRWEDTVKDLDSVQSWLETSNWLFKVSDTPYKTMLLPLLSFYQNLPNKCFSQANSKQLDYLKFWFYGSIFDNRYGGGRSGSTNVVIKKDCNILKNLAKNNFPSKDYWEKIRIEYSYEEFSRIDSNKNTKFMALSYFMWSKNKFMNLENNNVISITNKIDVHHIFPSNFLKEKYGPNSNEYDTSDSILNKIRINKISNIKISDRAPEDYLNDLEKINNNLNKSLDSHLVPSNPNPDYLRFIKDRYKLLEPILSQLKSAGVNATNNNEHLW